MPHSAYIKRIISQEFDLVGITKPELPDQYVQCLKEWLTSGFNANMEYLERNLKRKINLTTVLPNIQSVICTALNYYLGDHPNPLHKNEYKVARYAWGNDYHSIIEEKSARIIEKLRLDYPQNTFKPYVDYGPVLERAYAEMSGIGFIGKNGTIITKAYGSWVVLSVFLTDLKLTSDKPAQRSCGSCSKCIDACPTNAIIQEGIIDSNKCISYHTIENKEERIPESISQNLSKWVFGCDICQEICPHNCRAVKTTHKEFSLNNSTNTTLRKVDIEQMSEEQFNKHFKDSPIKRAKLSGLQRNIRYHE